MNKIIHGLLLALPVIALAQQAPSGNPQQIPDFKEVKGRMLPMIKSSLGPMTDTRNCVASSKNSEQLNQCVKIMADYQKKVMAGLNRPGKTAPPAPPTLEWTTDLKKRILTDMDISIKNTLATKSCLESSNSHEQMSQCMDRAGLKRPKGQQR